MNIYIELHVWLKNWKKKKEFPTDRPFKFWACYWKPIIYFFRPKEICTFFLSQMSCTCITKQDIVRYIPILIWFEHDTCIVSTQESRVKPPEVEVM